eukprot:5366426-Pyramimonas_sp.AAC.2
MSISPFLHLAASNLPCSAAGVSTTRLRLDLSKRLPRRILRPADLFASAPGPQPESTISLALPSDWGP